MKTLSMKKILTEAGIWGKVFGKKQDQPQGDGVPDKAARDIAQKLSKGMSPSPQEWKIYLSVLKRNFDYDDVDFVYQAGKKSGKLTGDQFRQLAQVLDAEYGYKTDISKEIDQTFGPAQAKQSRQYGPTTTAFSKKHAGIY